MSYSNQTFRPQAGQGNLSAQFSSPQYTPSQRGSAPQDIPGQRRRSSLHSGYGSYPPQNAGYPPSGAQFQNTPPGAYPQGGYGTSPLQMPMPPSQMPVHGTSPTSQPIYGTSPQATFQPINTNPGYAPGQPIYAPGAEPPMRPRSDSQTSHKSRRDSHSNGHTKPEKSHHHKHKEGRIDSPRRPTLSDSVMLAFDGLKGAFDSRK